jgi:hypothetical protein
VAAVALLIGFALVLDAAAAQICKRVMVTWNPERSERRYRVADPIYHHTLLPNVSVDAVWGGQTYPYRTNSLGFRDDSTRTVALRTSGRRVLLLGDSFTEGIGVPYELTFAGILADRLARCSVEVLNAAVSSYAPAIYYAKTRDLVERRRLEVTDVVVFIDVSDVTDEAKVYDLGPDGVVRDAVPPQSGRPGVLARVRGFIKDNSVAGHLAAMLLGAERRARATSGQFDLERAAWSVRPDSFASYGRRGLRLAQEHMDSLLAMTGRHRIALRIAVYPWPVQVARHDLGSPQRIEWRDWAASRGVQFFDLFPAFMRGGDPESTIRRMFIPGDIHWSPPGHSEVAREVGDLGLCTDAADRGGVEPKSAQ